MINSFVWISDSAHLQMLQMAASATQGGEIISSSPSITTANNTENNSIGCTKTSSAEKIHNMPTTTSKTSTTGSLSNEDKETRNSSSAQGDPSEDGNNQDNMGKALMQLYGMGQGLNSFPAGVSQANPFLHPTMFSATGRWQKYY